MFRYTINIQVVEVNDQGQILNVLDSNLMSVATTEPMAFSSARFAVGCEHYVETLINWGDLDRESLSETVPHSSLPRLPFLPPLKS